MTGRVASFRQVDVSRAIKAAKAAGLDVEGLKFGPEGFVVNTKTNSAPEADESFAKWEAEYRARQT